MDKFNKAHVQAITAANIPIIVAHDVLGALSSVRTDASGSVTGGADFFCSS